jgi:hypothetical protein
VAKPQVRLVSSAPPLELAQELANKLNCSLEEASIALSPPPRLTPKEDPLLPMSLPEYENRVARASH